MFKQFWKNQCHRFASLHPLKISLAPMWFPQSDIVVPGNEKGVGPSHGHGLPSSSALGLNPRPRTLRWKTEDTPGQSAGQVRLLPSGLQSVMVSSSGRTCENRVWPALPNLCLLPLVPGACAHYFWRRRFQIVVAIVYIYNVQLALLMVQLWDFW